VQNPSALDARDRLEVDAGRADGLGAARHAAAGRP
jgi:hypothetical protein